MSTPTEFPTEDQPDGEQKAHEEANRINENADDILRIFKKSKALCRFKDDVALLLAMLRDFATGRYKKVPYRIVIATAFTLTYVISILDAIPDTIPLAGFLDDAAVVALLLVWAEEEITRYRKWREKPLRE